MLVSGSRVFTKIVMSLRTECIEFSVLLLQISRTFFDHHYLPLQSVVPRWRQPLLMKVMKRAISDFREGEEQERGVQDDIDSDLEKLKNDLQKRREQLKRKLEEQKSPFHF